MHNHENIRSILGLSQDELAALLAVNRSQFSMYELGKRDLPASAKLKLAELLVNAPNKNLKTFKSNCITKEDEQKIINEFIYLNQREFQNLEKKIIRLNPKVAIVLLILLNYINFIDFLPIVKFTKWVILKTL